MVVAVGIPVVVVVDAVEAVVVEALINRGNRIVVGFALTVVVVVVGGVGVVVVAVVLEVIEGCGGGGGRSSSGSRSRRRSWRSNSSHGGGGSGRISSSRSMSSCSMSSKSRCRVCCRSHKIKSVAGRTLSKSGRRSMGRHFSRRSGKWQVVVLARSSGSLRSGGIGSISRGGSARS